MNHDYADIRKRIARPPLWWDENAVPRYCRFHPSKVANIYAQECVLLLIECQACSRPFKVALSFANIDLIQGAQPLKDRVRYKSISYLDPPNVWCCHSGPSMISEARRVLQFWQKNKKYDWVRVPKLEVDVTS